MQQFYFLKIILSLLFCNNATMQQFYILEIIRKFIVLQQCNNATILHLKNNSKFTICNNDNFTP